MNGGLLLRLHSGPHRENEGKKQHEEVFVAEITTVFPRVGGRCGRRSLSP